MFECWGWVMVDGTIAQRQAGNGTFPIELCTGAGCKLSASEPNFKFDARKRNRKPYQTLSAKEQNFSQAVPSLCARRVSKPCSSCGQYSQSINSAVTCTVQAAKRFTITLGESLEAAKSSPVSFESFTATKLSTDAGGTCKTI